MAKARQFEDAREFDVGDKVKFVYDDPTYGDLKTYVGEISAVSYGEDERQIRFNYRYTVSFTLPEKVRSNTGEMIDDVREVQCVGSELTLTK